MIDPDGLNVWCGQDLVGYLQRNSQGRISFEYEPKWLDSPNNFPVSITLPLRHEPFSAEEGLAHRYFANLLPEGGSREQIVRDLKIPDTDFDLLRAIGGECAGALSLLQAEHGPSEKSEYQELSPEDLANLVRRKGQPSTWKAADRPRLSLAGAQNKCPVLIRDGKYFLSTKEAPSSHILKFEIAGYKHLPAFETFTMLLARAVGLPTADITLEFAGKITFACVRRYDRAFGKAGEIERYHQEDFCQALGQPHHRKYESDGGSSFADCFRLLMDVSTDPAVDADLLLRWQIFNVLAGNSDGHAKNLSLLYLPEGDVRLSPFYDLICTRAIARIDEKIAFSVGGEKIPGLITDEHWRKLARDCGVKEGYVITLVLGTAKKLLDILRQVRREFEERYGNYTAIERIEKVVTNQCNRALKMPVSRQPKKASKRTDQE